MTNKDTTIMGDASTRKDEDGLSLERCAEAIAIAEGHESDIDDALHMANHRATAKAVLKAAGVKYKEGV